MFSDISSNEILDGPSFTKNIAVKYLIVREKFSCEEFDLQLFAYSSPLNIVDCYVAQYKLPCYLDYSQSCMFLNLCIQCPLSPLFEALDNILGNTLFCEYWLLARLHNFFKAKL